MDTCVCLLERDLLERQLDDAGLFFVPSFPFLSSLNNQMRKRKTGVATLAG